MSFLCIQCDTSHCQISLLLICICSPCIGEGWVERACARSQDRANSTDTNSSAQKKDATTLFRQKSSMFSSVYCRHCFSPQRADNTQASAKELTIIPTHQCWMCNFMPAGKVCEDQHRIRIHENPCSPTPHWKSETILQRLDWWHLLWIEHWHLTWKKLAKCFSPSCPRNLPFPEHLLPLTLL